MKNIIAYVVSALFLAGIGAAIFYSDRIEAAAFARDTNACNEVSKEARFSCYRAVLEQHGKGALEGFLKSIEANTGISFKNKDSGYAIFGANCHTFYHAVGDYIATHSEGQDIQSRVGLCSTTCTGGCIMGLYKRVVLQEGNTVESIKSLFPACPKGTEHQCAHEVGHILHDKYVKSVLAVIDQISLEKYGLEQPVAYAYTTSEKPDLDQPFEDCRAVVPAEELAYCLTGIGHNLFLFSEFNAGNHLAASKECELVAPENTEDCYKFLVYRIGINDAGPKFINYDAQGGNEVCSSIVNHIGRPLLMTDCYLGIGGGIGLYVDSEFAHQKITDENFAAVRKSVNDSIYLCEGAPEEYRLECYKGLLGTPLRKLYKTINLENEIIEGILPNIDDAFEIVG